MVLELLNTRPKNEKFPLWRRLQVERSEKDESKHDERPAQAGQQKDLETEKRGAGAAAS